MDGFANNNMNQNNNMGGGMGGFAAPDNNAGG